MTRTIATPRWAALIAASLGTLASAQAVSDTKTQETIHARTVVPDAARKVGEVRLLTRGGTTVVQTLLSTKLLGRVVSEVRAKEETNWPDGQPERPAMLRYMVTLTKLLDRLTAERDARNGDDRRLRLAIEFAATSHDASVRFAAFDGDERDGHLEPGPLREIETLVLDRTYVLRNMRLILADAFDVPPADVDRLGPLGPAQQP